MATQRTSAEASATPGTPHHGRPSSTWSTATSQASALERTAHEASRSSSGLWVGASSRGPRHRDLLSRTQKRGFRVIATSARLSDGALPQTGTCAMRQTAPTTASQPSLCAPRGGWPDSAERQFCQLSSSRGPRVQRTMRDVLQSVAPLPPASVAAPSARVCRKRKLKSPVPFCSL